MKELTKEKAVELHRAMWDYIVNALDTLIKEEMFFNGGILEFKRRAIRNIFCNGDLFKDATPEEYGFSNRFIEDCILVANYCFLCEYKMRLYNGCDYIQVLNCRDVCPLFNSNDKNRSCLNGLYDEFYYAFYAKDYIDCLDVATRIRDLPIVN